MNVIEDDLVPNKRFRYALYARKSTEDENRQVRSTGDQIKECLDLAARLDLNVIGSPLVETKSAKRPNQRPVFSQLLKDIEKNKYDGILCWHPDRLCRNMLEGGQIINMLDEGSLEDIKFVSHQFNNDANGKMLLGMLFVFSKQYSDDLSDKVTRGVQGNFREGKSSGAPKYGYDRDEITGYYVANENFDAVKQGWNMRSNGSSIEEVVEYLINSGVKRTTKNKANRRAVIPTKSTLSNVFKDPFYYGVLLQANQIVDLTTVSNFVPMISKELYESAQVLGYGRRKDLSDKKRSTFYPLRGMVYCAVCKGGKYMAVGKNKSQNGQHVLTYRCDNKTCTRKPKSLRAKHIFNSVYDLLDSLKFDESLYDRYNTEISTHTDRYIAKIKTELHSKRAILNNLNRDIDKRSLALGNIPAASKSHEAALNALEKIANDQADLSIEIKNLAAKIVNPAKIALNKTEFLNLLKTAPDKMRSGTAVEKDRLCRILFLNFAVDNEKIASYHWNEPFDSFVKMHEIQVGGGTWT